MMDKLRRYYTNASCLFTSLPPGEKAEFQEVVYLASDLAVLREQSRKEVAALLCESKGEREPCAECYGKADAILSIIFGPVGE